MAFLKDRAVARRELFAALTALPETEALLALRALLAGACTNAVLLLGTIHNATMRASWAFRPNGAFNVRESGGFVVHVWL